MNDTSSTPRSTNMYLGIFTDIRAYLDWKQDKMERIAVLGRSMTYESKRIIFLLHRISTDKSVLDKAESRLRNICDQGKTEIIYRLAKELEDEDFWPYLRFYTAGIQEYVEALALWKYLKFGTVITHEEAQSFLSAENKSSNSIIHSPSESDMIDNKQTSTIKIPLPYKDFILGIADFTGELMRTCVTAAAAGNKEVAFNTCYLVQEIYRQMHGLSALRKDIQVKLYALRGSVCKMETVCYLLKIRDTFEFSKPLPELPTWNVEEKEHGYCSDEY